MSGGHRVVNRAGLRQGFQVPGSDLVTELDIAFGQDMDFCIS